MRLLEQDGQVLALSVLMLAAVIGMATLVLDVGVWFREDRQLQAVVDAAAAAGAQALPDDPGGAVALALEYADKNGGGVAPDGVTVAPAADSVTVRGSRDAPGFLSRVFGVVSVQLGARATARVWKLGRARYVAPIVVHETHPLLQCLPDPCFDVETQLSLVNLKDPESANGSGAFGLVNYLSGSGTAPVSLVADWVRDGYQGLLSPGLYRSATGAKFNASEVRAALAERTGDEVLLPVYRSLTGTGQNAQYEIVGWVGFLISGFAGGGDSGTLSGSFRRVTWDGEEAAAGDGLPDLGARMVALVE